MTAVLERPSRASAVVALEGPLRVPLDGALRRTLRTLGHDGHHRVVLDLAQVPAIDAGGIGELVRAYRRLEAVNGALRIVHAGGRVREPLQLAGLSDLFGDDDAGALVEIGLG